MSLPIANSRLPVLLGLAVSLLVASGCFREHSFPIRARDYLPVSYARRDAPATAREWLESAQPSLRELLPERAQRGLLTDDLVDARGRPVDVYEYFDRRPKALRSVFTNYYGLLHSAQATGADPAIEEAAPPWDGFEDVWIPVDEGVELAGRLGLARDAEGRVIDAHCIVVLPGLLGDNANKRSRDLAVALRDYGYHALALELRGFGQTEHRFPEVPYFFGLVEAGDLLRVAEWLQDRPQVLETGLIGYCWGANVSLLAAWEDGRADDDPDVTPAVREILHPRTDRPHFRAGVIAFSPVLRYEDIVDALDEPANFLTNPVLHTIQANVRERMARKGHPNASGNLRELIHMELDRVGLDRPEIVSGGFRYLRMLPDPGRPVGRKFEHTRVPVLLVHGVNDPLCSAQAVADLIARTGNPNVAAIVLDGGGHVGFAAYARGYFYSVVLNFFDWSTRRGMPHFVNAGPQPPQASATR